jgi:rhamnose transport system ATP-binding protein
MSEYILELKQITKSFSGVEVLHGASFSLRPGEVHALLGENGAGKSTLVKIITGVHQPDSGQIILDGAPVHFNDTRESNQAGIAAIYQELSLFPDLDVAENIFAGRQPVRFGGAIDWRKMYAEAGKLLASLGVRLDLQQKARTLSIAEQQMVEIARAFSINARILIMDEATSALTLNEVVELFRLVRRLKEQGTAIIFISHRFGELFELADRVTVLRDGAYVDTQAIKDVSHNKLIHMMVGRTITELFPKQDVEAGEVVLKVEHLTRDGAFKDVSFELRRGEILGIAGLVGSGRTSLVRAIFGVEPAVSGTIQIEGREVSITSAQQAIQLGLAYVPEDRQMHGLLPAMPIKSNISLPTLSGYSRYGWIEDRAELRATHAAASQLDVRANHMGQAVRELSGGNQQKVVLAKWLSTKPRILILDEPTRGIDVGTKAAVHALMGELAAQGVAILMISSELPEILGMSDRILVMREGSVAGRFSRAEATQEIIMRAALEAATTGFIL